MNMHIFLTTLGVLLSLIFIFWLMAVAMDQDRMSWLAFTLLLIGITMLSVGFSL